MTNISQHGWLSRVSDYHDGDMDEAEATAVENHLAGCEDCRRALAIYRRFYVLASEPSRLGEPSRIVAEQHAMSSDMSSDRMRDDALDRDSDIRGGRRLERNRRTMGITSLLAASLVIVGFVALLGPRIGRQMSDHSYPPPVVIRTPLPYPALGVPITPVATPGPQVKYVYLIVTAQGVSANFVPVNETSHFQAMQYVYVVCEVHGIPKGQTHTVSIHWFYDNQDLELPSRPVQTYQNVSSDQVVYFRLLYPYPGLGMAKIFFDLPSSDAGDSAADPYLAGQVYFAVDPAGTATPTAHP